MEKLVAFMALLLAVNAYSPRPNRIKDLITKVMFNTNPISPDTEKDAPESLKDIIEAVEDLEDDFHPDFNLPALLEVKTHGGNSDGADCVFPFLYKGYIQTACVDKGKDGKPWCSTTMNYDKDGKWGYCIPVELTAPTLSPAQKASKCLFVPGDAGGYTQKKVSSSLQGDACVNKCLEMKKNDPNINGATVYSAKRGGCWCDWAIQYIHKTSWTLKTYKTCVFRQDLPILPYFYYPVGTKDNIGMKQYKEFPGLQFMGFGAQWKYEYYGGCPQGSLSQCIEYCARHRKSDPNYNGLMYDAIPYRGDLHACWCTYKAKYLLAYGKEEPNTLNYRWL